MLGAYPRNRQERPTAMSGLSASTSWCGGEGSRVGSGVGSREEGGVGRRGAFDFEKVSLPFLSFKVLTGGALSFSLDEGGSESEVKLDVDMMLPL